MLGFLLVAAIGVAIAGLYFPPINRVIRDLGKNPKTNIADFTNSESGKVVGKLAYLGETLVSPLTGRECAYYAIRVEEYHDLNWHTMIRESAGVEFEVVDHSGKAIVEPMEALVAITMDSHTTSGTFDRPTPKEAAFLAKHPHEGRGWMSNKRLRYYEGVLERGELVAILGKGVKEFDGARGTGEQGYRDAAKTRLRMKGAQNEPVKISDDPETTRW